MKKVMFFMAAFITIFLPFKVKAASIASIDSVSIGGETSKKTGETLSINCTVHFSGLQKGFNQTLGVWVVNFELNFDDSVFIPTDISSPNFDSNIFKYDGKYYVVGVVDEDHPTSHHCAEGALYCDDYNANIKLYVKDTNANNSSIKIETVEAQILDMTDDTKEYTLNDTRTISHYANKTHTVSITKTNSNTSPPANSIVENKNPTTSVPNTAKETKTESSPSHTTYQNNTSNSDLKSSNSYLKLLEIENQKINFDKNKQEYNIIIDKDINQINVKAETEDEKASLKITGSDDLKANNYTVTIEVIAEDNSKNTYIIKTHFKNEKKESSWQRKKKKKTIKIDKKIVIFSCIGIGVLLILIFIIYLISHKKDKKLEKILDEL